MFSISELHLIYPPHHFDYFVLPLCESCSFSRSNFLLSPVRCSLPVQADKMSFFMEYLRRKIAENMEDPEERSRKWEQHIRNVQINAKAAYVPLSHSFFVPLLIYLHLAGKQTWNTQQRVGVFGGVRRELLFMR